MSHKNNDAESRVYSTTGFSDLVSSPVFYSVLVLTILLGLSSAFGFFQNPLKLKAVIEVISQKVSLSDDIKMRSVSQRGYSISSGLQRSANSKSTFSMIDKDRYSILAKSFSALQNSRESNSSIKLVSFDYDITSKQFWSDLDLSKIESTIEESQRKSKDLLIIGTPLEQKSPAHRDGYIYSLNANNILRL